MLNVVYDPFLTRKTTISEKNFFIWHFFTLLCAFPRIRQHYIKVLLIVLKAQMGVAPKYLRDVIRLPTSATSLRPLRSMERRELLSLGLGQPWPCLDPLPLLPLLFGIAFHLPLVLLSYHPIFLHVRPYHFSKLVSFLEANRTKSASVCLCLLRGA